MALSGVLFVLFLAGCWLYSLTDAALTPARDFRGLSKPAWISIISTTFIIGAVAWLIARRSRATKSWATSQPGRTTLAAGPSDEDFGWYTQWTAADDAIARHPAGRSRKADANGWTMPKGPDDDPDFLRQLDHRIKGTSADTGE
jgi:hypothetical protein